MEVSEALRCVEDGESGTIGITLAAEVKRLQTSLAGRTYCHSDAEVEADLDFAYKRAKVLADMLEIPVHESPEVTGTILGLVRGKVERMSKKNAEMVAVLKDIYRITCMTSKASHKEQTEIFQRMRRIIGAAAE